VGALAAIFHWTDEPVARAALDRMVGASSFRAIDRVGAAFRPAVALAQLSFATTATEQPDPIVDEPRGLALAFDGRLDNREDLLAVLGLPVESSDAVLAFEAIARWGHGAAPRLLGDFAFVSWNERTRTALCARDHFGIRPLHYHAHAARLLCATDVSSILAHGGVAREPDVPIVASYLARTVPNDHRTVFRHVNRLPPGHQIVAGARGLRLERYWSLEPRERLRFARDEDYAEACREVLVQAVRARLRSDRPVAALLSGGLDSSSIVTVAHRLVDDRTPPSLFTAVVPDHPESDEREYIDAVVRACGVPTTRIAAGPVSARGPAAQARDWGTVPGLPGDEAMAPLCDAIRSSGHRVVLGGAGGDHLFGGSMFRAADLLRRGRLATALAAVWREAQAAGPMAAAAQFVQAGVWPVLPRAAKPLLRPLARRVTGAGAPSWLRGEPAVDTHPDAPRGGSFATDEIIRRLGSGLHAHFLECHERVFAAHGLEARHPLLDRRVIEFALALPEDQRWRSGVPKHVLRSALQGWLPDAVRTRRSKADFSYVIADALDVLGLPGELRIAAAGWVDGGAVTGMLTRTLEQYRAGAEGYTRSIAALWMIAAVEVWYRCQFVETPAGYNASREVAHDRRDP
jgi:asparagine synthase (glutamine-hydrolysing)